MKCGNPTALELALYNLSVKDYSSTTLTNFSTNDTNKYNPYQTIPNGITPITFWECLSVLNNFTPLSNRGERDNDQAVILDLDPTDGCTMALKGRYPKCIIYCSTVKKLSKNTNVDMTLIMCHRRTPRTVTEYLLTYNNRGCDFAFCVDQPDFDLQRQVYYSHKALKLGASMSVRVKNFESSRVKDMIKYMLPLFDTVWIYKCATMSCVTNEVYIVGVSKHDRGTIGILQGLDEVKSFIEMSKANIVARTDNTDKCAIESLISEYLGL